MLESIDSQCVEKESADRIMVFRDKRGSRSKYIAMNESNKLIKRFLIDGVMINSGYRCDYGLGIKSEHCVYLIELKGCDLVHAVEQIDSTMNYIKARGISPVFYGRIVLTKVSGPDIRDIKYRRLSMRLMKNGGNLKQQVRQMEEVV